MRLKKVYKESSVLSQMKLFGKRGQEFGLSLPTLIVILLLIAFVVGYFTVGGRVLDYFKGAEQGIPLGDLEAISQRCRIDLQNDLRSDFCLEFKQTTVGKNTEYLNCQDSRLNLTLSSVDARPIVCGTTPLTIVDETGVSSEQQIPPAGKKCYDILVNPRYDGTAVVNGVAITQFPNLDSNTQVTSAFMKQVFERCKQLFPVRG